MTVIDHGLFFCLAVAYPTASIISFRRLLRRGAAGEIVRPSEIYRSTAIGHWAVFSLTLVIWLVTGRSWEALGFSWALDAGFVAGLALTVATILVLLRQYGRLAAAGDKTRESLLEQLGDLSILLPRNDRELGQFYAVSATAGIVEETIWRGYMFWYLGQFMPLWAAALVSTVFFGLGHSYQGLDNVPRVTLVGGVFAALYLLTGSLWLPMLLHAVFDAIQGRAAYGVISNAPVAPGDSLSGERA